MTVEPCQVLRVRMQTGVLRPGIYRVVLVAPREGVVCLYRMTDKDVQLSRSVFAKPLTLPLTPLNEAIEQNAASVVGELSRPTPKNASLEQIATHKRREANEGILTPLVEPDMLFRMLVLNTWQSDIQLIAKSHQVSAHKVGRLLCKYFFVGLNLAEACRPDFWVKGPRRNVKNKLGRRHDRVKSNHRPDAIGRNTDDQDKTNIEVFYNSLEDQTISVAHMYRDYEEAYRPERLIVEAKGSMHVQLDAARAFITERQFRYALKGIKGELELLLKAAGERKTSLQHRVALGSARDRIPYPGHTYIIDATVADVYLVSAFDRRRIIGRPVIYVVIDAFSSLIVSVHVALSGPSLEQARIAMFRAVADKTRWLKWLGVENVSRWLPQGCRPTFWLADRGELHSKGSYEMQFKLETNLSIAAAYRADWKSFVERSFGVLNTELIHWIPGAVRQRVRERGTADPRLDAVLTLKEFTRLVVRSVAILNFTRDMSRHLSASFIRHGVQANPVGFWRWGLQYVHGSASYLSYEDALRATTSATQASLTRFGVVAGQDRYVADWMREHEAVRLAGFGVAASARVFASPDEPGHAWCALPSEQGLREVQLHADRQVADQYSLEDILESAAVRKFAGQDMADDTAAERVALQRESRRDIDEATKLARAANTSAPMTKSARTSEIKANRRQEEEVLVKAVGTPAAAPALPAVPIPPVPIPPVPIPAVLALPSPAPAGATVDGLPDDYFARLDAQLDDWSAA